MSKRLKEEEARSYRIVSRILGVITRIGSIGCWIGAFGVLIATVAVAIIAPNIKIDSDNKEITLFDKTSSYTIRDKEFELGDGDEKVVVKNNEVLIGENGSSINIKLSDEDINKIEEFIENDALRILAVLPFALAAATVAVVFIALALGNGASVLKNVATKKTPFTKENIDRTEKIAKFLIISYAITLVANLIMSIVARTTANLNFGSIFSILFVYVFVYILKAGYQLEDKGEKEEE